MRITHKNMLVEAFRQSRFGIDSFDISESTGENGTEVLIIIFKDSPLQFIIKPFPYNYNVYSPSYVTYGPKYQVTQLYAKTYTINEVILLFKSWLTDEVQPYVEDKNAIDLWKEYKNGFEYLKVDDIQVDDTTNFSQDEQIRIKFSIEDLKGLISTKVSVSENQQIMINAKLDYLIDALPRMSKTDWKGISIGIIASIIIALSLDTEKGGQLWELFLQVFRIVPLISGSTS
jgi:hypothetical protein